VVVLPGGEGKDSQKTECVTKGLEVKQMLLSGRKPRYIEKSRSYMWRKFFMYSMRLLCRWGWKAMAFNQNPVWRLFFK
jgi:hypothetical protein